MIITLIVCTFVFRNLQETKGFFFITLAHANLSLIYQRSIQIDLHVLAN